MTEAWIFDSTSSFMAFTWFCVILITYINYWLIFFLQKFGHYNTDKVIPFSNLPPSYNNDNIIHDYLLFWINCTTSWNLPLNLIQEMNMMMFSIKKNWRNWPLNSLNQLLYSKFVNIFGVTYWTSLVNIYISHASL